MKTLLLAISLSLISFSSFASPASSCRNSLMRYGSLPASMIALCKQANEHSAHAIDIYTSIYTGTFPQSMLQELLRINSSEEADCAVSIARRYNGTMSVGFLRRSCF